MSRCDVEDLTTAGNPMFFHVPAPRNGMRFALPLARLFRLRARHVMGIVVAILAQGSMGSAVGKRLHERGAEVRTLLGGRSAASAERARAAGMKPAADQRALLDGADFFLSI